MSVTLNLWISSFYFPSARNSDMSHHVWFYAVMGTEYWAWWMLAVFLANIYSLFRFYQGLVRYISVCMCMFMCGCTWTCVHNPRLTGIFLKHSLLYYWNNFVFLTILELCVYVCACGDRCWQRSEALEPLELETNHLTWMMGNKLRLLEEPEVVLNAESSFQLTSTLIFERGSLMDLEFINLTRLTGLQTPGILLFLPPQH